MKKVTILTTHPVPYQVPLYRELSNIKEIDLTVYFDENFRKKFDYGKDVLVARYLKSEIDLLSGFNSKSPNYEIEMPKFIRRLHILRQLLETKPEIMIIFGFKGIIRLYFLLFGKYHGIKIIFKAEVNSLKSRYEQKMTRRLMRPIKTLILLNVHKVIVSCKNGQDYFEALQVNSSKQLFMPCAVDNDRIEKWQCNNNWKYEEKTKIHKLLFVGALEKRKRPDILIDAMSRLSTHYDVELCIVGEGSLETRLRELVLARHLGSCVSFKGYQFEDEIYKLYTESDALILPSIRDPSPKVVNEAMCFGLLPVVSNQVGTVGDLVEHGRNGLVFDPFCSDDLFKKLVWCLENTDKVNVMKGNAKNSVKNWSHKVGVDAFIEKMQIK